jgi:hypothetical protein
MKIELPRVTIQDDGEDVLITHRKMPAETRVSKKKLDQWCIQRLRDEISEKVQEKKQ